MRFTLRGPACAGSVTIPRDPGTAALRNDVADDVKLKHVVIFIAGVLLCVIFVAGTTIATSAPRGYKFLEGQDAVYVEIVADGGPLGREARFYLVNRPMEELLPDAERELLKANFKPDGVERSTVAFQRGQGDRVEIHPALGCKHDEVVKRVPEEERSAWTVVKTVDPRLRRAAYRKIIEYGKQTPPGKQIVEVTSG